MSQNRISNLPSYLSPSRLDRGVKFLQRLEKYIDDTKKNRNNYNSDTVSDLKAKESLAANLLDPRSANLFGLYGTALKYDQKARFVAGVSDTAQDLANIHRAVSRLA